MQTLEPNLSAIILSYLDDNSLNVLTSVLPEVILQSQKTNTYWHEKTELLLNKQLGIKNYNWKQIYDILSSVSKNEWINAAIYYDSLDTIKILVIIGEINNTNVKNDLVNPVNIAAQYGKLNILNFLLNNEITENIQEDSDLMTLALQRAIPTGNIEIINIFLKKPIYVNRCFYIAINNANDQLVDILLKDKRAHPENVSFNLIERACQMGATSIVKLLLNDGRVIPPDKSLLLAISRGYDDIVKLLLNDLRINPAIENNQILIIAISSGKFDIVDLLIKDQRINPADDSNLALNTAIKNCNKKMVELLLQNDDIVHNLNKIPIIVKDMIEYSVKGMIIGNYFRDGQVSNTYHVETNKSENKLYGMILRYVMIRRPKLIQIIDYLRKILQDNNPWVNKIKDAVNLSARNILQKANNLDIYDISDLRPSSKDLYHILMTFFLLLY
jgi:ankyrin repeat protein